MIRRRSFGLFSMANLSVFSTSACFSAMDGVSKPGNMVPNLGIADAVDGDLAEEGLLVFDLAEEGDFFLFFNSAGESNFFHLGFFFTASLPGSSHGMRSSKPRSPIGSTGGRLRGNLSSSVG